MSRPVRTITEEPHRFTAQVEVAQSDNGRRRSKGQVSPMNSGRPRSATPLTDDVPGGARALYWPPGCAALLEVSFRIAEIARRQRERKRARARR
jgi:hypothetical protein